MKKIFLIYLFIIVHCTMNIENCEAQWIQTNGPNGGYITSFAQVGNIIFAGTISAGAQGSRAGIFYSTNNGIDWLPGGLSSISIYSLVSESNILYAGGYGGAYESTNEGLDWNFIGLSNYSVMSLAIKNGNIFAGVSGSGLFFSSNNGTNWEQRINGLNSNTVISLNIYGNNIYAGGNNGFYFSTNEGLSWSTSNNLLTNKLVRTIMTSGNKIYSGTDYHGVFSSTNNGIDWVSIGLDSTSINSLINYNNIIYAGTNNGIYLYTNIGSNWNVISIDLLNTVVVSLLFSNSFFLSGTYLHGIYLSTDNGLNWTSKGFPYQNAIALTSIGTNVYAGCMYSGVYETTNDGLFWIHLKNISQNITVTSLSSYNSRLIVGTYESGIYITTNNGINWINTVNAGSSWLMKNINGVIYAGAGYDKMLRSTNGGDNWTYLYGISGKALSVTAKDSLIFVGTEGYGIFLSSNNGMNWIPVNNGIQSYAITSLEVLGSKIFAGNNAGVFVSTNNGNNWDSSLIPGASIVDIKVFNNIIIAGTYKSVFKSTNSGLSWLSVSDGISCNDYVGPFLFANNFVFMGSDISSVWRRPLNEIIGVRNISSTIPDNYKLYQNYPNPFNSNTKIKFSIAENGKWKMENGFVKLIVYDILGKEISILVNEKLQTGTYEIKFDGRNLPSGIYFYKLMTNDFSETRRMLMIK